MEAMMNKVELMENELELVNGGNFLPNDFDEEVYHQYGVKTKYHIFANDEFWLPDGYPVDHHGANAWVRLCKRAEKKDSSWRWEYNYKNIIGH